MTKATDIITAIQNARAKKLNTIEAIELATKGKPVAKKVMAEIEAALIKGAKDDKAAKRDVALIMPAIQAAADLPTIRMVVENVDWDKRSGNATHGMTAGIKAHLDGKDVAETIGEKYPELSEEDLAKANLKSKFNGLIDALDKAGKLKEKTAIEKMMAAVVA